MANNIAKKGKNVTKKHLARKEKENRQTKIILIFTIAVLAVIVGLVGYGLVDNYLIKPNILVAKVGDDKIQAGEFTKQVSYYRLNMINQAYMNVQYASMFGELGSSFYSQAQNIVSQLFDDNSVGQGVLDMMIDRIIMDKQAAKYGITVSDEEIQLAKQAAFEFYPDGTPTPTITPTKVFTPTLSSDQAEILGYTPTSSTIVEEPETTESPESTPATNSTEEVATAEPVLTDEVAVEPQATETVADEAATPLPEPTITPTPTVYTTKGFAGEYKNYLNSLSSISFNEKDTTETFRYQILREKLLEEVTKDLEPFEEQVWARHILVATEEEATTVLDRLAAGEDFVELASELSLDTGSAADGGDLGWFGRGMMVSEFEEAAYALQEGEISQPVQTVNGWHIIQVIGKGNNALNSNEFKNFKENYFSDWIKSIRDERSDIVIEENWINFVPNTPEVPQTLLTSLYSQ